VIFVPNNYIPKSTAESKLARIRIPKLRNSNLYAFRGCVLKKNENHSTLHRRSSAIFPTGAIFHPFLPDLDSDRAASARCSEK
jgi:hypothetical protein